MLLLKNGERVSDRHKSKITKELLSLLPEALATIEANKQNFFIAEVDMQRVVGETICVETNDNDEIVYAKRVFVKNERLTRFVKNRSAEPCQFITVILKRDQNDLTHYIMIDAFIGKKAEPEPGDPNENDNSVIFWSKHALVYGSQEIIPGTEKIF